MKAKQLAELGLSLLDKKSPLTSLHQEIAENFYPERADFTVTRSLGDDFMSNLMTSYPVICRRTLADQIGTMLRPKARPWFHVVRQFDTLREKPNNDVRKTLESFEQTMRRAMYDPIAHLNKATKVADNDFTTFGEAALSVEVNRNADALLFRTWHLRDMAWAENADGGLGIVVRKWKTYLQVFADTFGREKLHEKLQKRLDKNPLDEHEILHIVCDAEMYDENAKGRPRWSIWRDVENDFTIEETPIWGKHYIIPRWQPIGSQYSHSPAVIAALPDARLIQAMTFTMLEVGEKAANPPMVATVDAVRSDVSLFAGGITWVDKEYDQRLGAALQPVSQDMRGFGFGMEMTRETREIIKEAFFLNKLTPFNPGDPEMTAFQAGQLVQEYIRNALPIFEPMEQEYNAALCEEVFGLMVRHGAFGSPLDWPREMRNMDVEFQFESPLHDVIDQQKTQKWMEAKALLADAIAFDPSTAYIMDAPTALRDALSGAAVPASWLHSEADTKRAVEQAKAEQHAQQSLAALQQGAETGKTIAEMGATMNEATQ